MRAAACGAVQALSRSAKDLRGELCEPAIAASLCRALRDADPAVRSAATAALCNLVLDFSLLKACCPVCPSAWHCARRTAAMPHCVTAPVAQTNSSQAPCCNSSVPASLPRHDGVQ